MDNRYGRHGPHAWRRWHERRFHRCSSYFDNSAYTVIVHVQLPPVKTERVIFIIMPNAADFEEEDDFAEIRSDQSSISLSQSTVNHRLIENVARRQARKDAKEIERLNKNGNFVRVQWDKVAYETDSLAEEAIETLYPGAQTPDDRECDLLVEKYQDAYQQSFKERLNSALVDYFDTELETRLRKIAIADRENTPQHTPSHIRDLAVVRVLFQLNVSLDVVDDHLTEIHKWADKYEGYYSNPREEVIWPDCRGSF